MVAKQEIMEIAHEEFFKEYQINKAAYYDDPKYRSFISLQKQLYIAGFIKSFQMIGARVIEL